MDEIIVGFSRPKNKFKIGSYLIRLWLQTNYSHVYIKFYSKSLDRTLIYEAVGSGVRFIGCTQWETHANEVKSFKLNISKDNYLSLLRFCVDNAGVKYGYWQNLGIVIVQILNLKKNPFKKGINCSEILAKIIIPEGYLFKKDLDLVTPKDIYNVLVENNTLNG